jgi:hypothetical protein
MMEAPIAELDGPRQTIGLNIQLPLEQEVNQYVSRELVSTSTTSSMRNWFVYPRRRWWSFREASNDG